MTTPGATEAVTPEQRADEIVNAVVLEYGDECFISDAHGPGADLRAAIAKALREAEANALRRAMGLAKEWSDNWRKGGEAVPRESENSGDGWYRSTISTAEARARVLDAFIDHIRSLLPKEEGK